MKQIPDRSVNRFASLLACLAFIAGGARADALFESDDTVAVTLTGPLTTLAREKDKSQAYPGTLVHGEDSYDVKISVRGNKRLDTCRHPPLRINFRKKLVKDTLFDHQDDLKLVVECARGSRYQDYVRTEYLTYRMLNRLTEASYRVRWLAITFQDSDGRAEPRSEHAFFIERKSRLARRLNLDAVDVERIGILDLDEEQAVLVNLFQFVIANPDYSIIAPPPGESCCHNARLLTAGDRYVPVIYDFDSTGLVNASYAVPTEGLGISRVTQRVYRGFCEHNAAADRARKLFLDNEAAVLAMFADDPLLSPRGKKHTGKFLTRSFDILREDRQFERSITSRCR